MRPGVVTVIQARTGSSRLPGKVLLPLGDSTVLEVMIGRVRAAKMSGTVVVATTRDASDDAIVAVAEHANVPVFRGHATDLLDRHYECAGQFGARHVVKIPSDCPLIDPAVIDDAIRWYLERPERFDYVSNLHPPTHPDGNDVEIMSMKALATAWRVADKPHEREHTTPYVWNHPEQFRLGNVVWSAHADCSLSHRVVLDYREDYEVIRAVYEGLVGLDGTFSADDVVRFLDAHPEVASLNAARRGTAWYSGMADRLPGLRGTLHRVTAPNDA